jgi:heme a synthase
MILFHVVIGGVTRLTGSGLSITKWDIVTGSIPPLDEASWNNEFDLYKATPQYQKINEGMSLSEFKFIYFWEYIHRLWARSMGFVFLIPLAYFLFKGWIDALLKRQLILVFISAAIVASFGWIMVASGLVSRPWVNAYKLTLHLNLAFMCYGILLWTTFSVFHRGSVGSRFEGSKRFVYLFLGLVMGQLLLGGIMSGMKAGLSYPTWPSMNGSFIPSILFEGENWKWVHFTDYDTNGFAPAFIQFFHRLLAYIIFGLVLYIYYTLRNSSDSRIKKASLYMLITVSIQVLIGIVTIINCNGKIPVIWGVLHQIGALMFYTACVYYLFITCRKVVS